MDQHAQLGLAVLQAARKYMSATGQKALYIYEKPEGGVALGVDVETEDVTTLSDLAPQMAEMLLQLEWSALWSTCPTCAGRRGTEEVVGVGHRDDCKLGALCDAIRAARGGK